MKIKLLLAVTLGSASGLWHLSCLSEQLVRSAALESAAQHSEIMDTVNHYYAELLNDLKHQEQLENKQRDAEKKPGKQQYFADRLPPPATVTIACMCAICGSSTISS